MHVLKPRTNNKNVYQEEEEKNIQNVLTNTHKIFIYIYIEAPFQRMGRQLCTKRSSQKKEKNKKNLSVQTKTNEREKVEAIEAEDKGGKKQLNHMRSMRGHRSELGWNRCSSLGDLLGALGRCGLK